MTSTEAEITAKGKGGTGQKRGRAERGKAESTTAPRGTGGTLKRSRTLCPGTIMPSLQENRENLSCPNQKQLLLRSRCLCPAPQSQTTPKNSYVEDLNVMILGDGPLRSLEFTEGMGGPHDGLHGRLRRGTRESLLTLLQLKGGHLQARKRSLTRDHPAGS